VAVSPADFELYARVTGRRARTREEQIALAPEVFKFTREFGRGQQIEEKPSVIQQIAGTLGNVALAGAGIAGAYGLARALGPQTDISPVSTAATSDVGEIPTRVGQKGFVRHPTPPKDPTRELDPSKMVIFMTQLRHMTLKAHKMMDL